MSYYCEAFKGSTVHEILHVSWLCPVTSFDCITVETLSSTTAKYGKKLNLCAMVHVDACSGNCNSCGSVESLCSVTRELVTHSGIYICV